MRRFKNDESLMKVLSLRQPYAEWVISGKKTIELRSWNTKYRGKLLIHASGKHSTLPTGAIIGSVELVDVKEYNNEKEFAEDKDKHLAGTKWTLPFAKRPFKYGFILRNPKRFEKPIPVKGRLGLWEF